MSGLALMPETVVGADELWTVALNRNQNLLGKTMLVLNRACTAVAEVNPEEWTALLCQIQRLSRVLDSLFSPDQFNFAFLMNQDAQVHLHVVPRYAGPRHWEGLSFDDPHWGGSFGYEQRFLSADHLGRLAQSLRAALEETDVSTPAASQWAQRWQASWGRMEEALAPARQWQLGGLVELVEALAGPTPRVVDLACGTGSLAIRLLERFPGAAVEALDVDPVLLAIAKATFAGDQRVRVITGDLRSPGWAEALGDGEIDAVVTSTALHWLAEPVVRRLYRDLAGLIRPGGLFAHAEIMPITDAPHIGEALASQRRAGGADTRARWDEWWSDVEADPDLRPFWSAREAVFSSTYPATEFSPPAAWHREALLEAGFQEAGVVFRSGGAATVAAIR